MDRPRALGLAFLAVWTFGLVWNGGVSVEATAILTGAVAILNILAARLLPDPIRLSKLGIVFFIGVGLVFLIQLSPTIPILFPITAQWRLRHGIHDWWCPATADTYRTLLALTTLLLYALSTLLTIRLRQAGLGTSVLLRAVLVVLLGEAVYSLFQVFMALKDQPFYGSRVLPGVASGTLVGRNNFAGLMGIGLVISLSLAWARFSWPLRRPDDLGKPRLVRRLEGSANWAIATAVFSIAMVLSRSRGGVLATLGGALLLPFVYRGRGNTAGFAGVVLIVLGAACIAGLQPLLDRFAGMDLHDLSSENRLTIFSTTVLAGLRQPILGFGFGSHPVAYHPYQPPSIPGQIHHAHNEYINLFFEAGIVGASIFIASSVFWLIRTCRTLRPLPGPDRIYLAASIAAVTVTLIHSLVDFDLRIPSIGMLFATLVGIGGAASRGGEPRSNWALGLTIMAMASGLALFLGIDPTQITERARTESTDQMERLSFRALQLSPYEYRAAWALARAAQRRGETALAGSRFETAAALWPAHPDIQKAAGLWFWQGKDRRAPICFRRWFEQEPDQIGAIMNDLWGEESRSLEEYESLLPTTPEAGTEYASFLARRGQWAAGIHLFNSRVAAIPKNARSYDRFASTLEEVGQWGLEADVLERRLALKSDPAAYEACAQAWLRLGMHERALEYAITGCRIDPSRSSCWALRGEVLRAKGCYLEATESFTQALSLSPMELRYLEERGWTYLEMKMLDLASDDFRTALRSKPLDRFLVFGLAQALSGLNQQASAELLLDEYLRKHPDDNEAESLRRSLQR